MTLLTPTALALATWFPAPLRELAEQLAPLLQRLVVLITTFRSQPVTPASACQFEHDLADWLRLLGRTVVAWTFNHLEPDEPDAWPARLRLEGFDYRRRPKAPNRALDSLFGPIRLERTRYEALGPGEPSRFPLEERLGIVAGRATAALAERVGQNAAQHPQQQVLSLLRRDHGVQWSVESLREVTQRLRAGLEAQRCAAQVAKLLALLQQAAASSGPHRPTLSVGRDGIFLPLRGDTEYREGATATVSVLDRRGQRLGTVYLGHMPEEGQASLTRQLTEVLHGVLRGWPGVRPRLQYVTDAGHHPTQFFRKVLLRMEDPRRPGRRLKWLWVIDYYHACSYVHQLATALYGATREAEGWARKMRRWLKEKRRGIYRVLHSAAALRCRRRLSRAAATSYRKAYRYLRKRLRYLDYARYRQQGLAIGSGVTEAGCKTVFTQRLKQSGMTWEVEGGQTIVDLRVVWLSGVWEETHQRYLAARLEEADRATQGCPCGKNVEKAA